MDRGFTFCIARNSANGLRRRAAGKKVNTWLAGRLGIHLDAVIDRHGEGEPDR